MIPLRDPFGFNDFDHYLTTLLGRPATVASHAETVALLRKTGALIWDRRELAIGLLGETAIVSMDTHDDPHGYDFVLGELNRYDPSRSRRRKVK